MVERRSRCGERRRRRSPWRAAGHAARPCGAQHRPQRRHRRRSQRSDHVHRPGRRRAERLAGGHDRRGRGLSRARGLRWPDPRSARVCAARLWPPSAADHHPRRRLRSTATFPFVLGRQHDDAAPGVRARRNVRPEACSAVGDEEEWLLAIERRAGASATSRRPPSITVATAADSRLSALARAAYGQGREVAPPRSPQRQGTVRVPRSSTRWPAAPGTRCGAGARYGIVMGARTAGTLREALAERRG